MYRRWIPSHYLGSSKVLNKAVPVLSHNLGIYNSVCACVCVREREREEAGREREILLPLSEMPLHTLGDFYPN